MAHRVLLMCRGLNAGGSERQMTEIAKALDRSRFEPHVGAFRPHAMRGKDLQQAGVPVAEFPVYSLKSAGAMRGAFQLARYIRRHNIRLVHTWDYPTTVFAIPVARALTSAVAVSSQRSERSLIPHDYIGLVRFTDRLTKAVVVNCEFLRGQLAEQEELPKEKIRLCYNGIDMEAFRAKSEQRSSELTIGVVCVLRPEKGLSVLLDAFATLQRPGVKLLIVGSGPMLPELERRARELGISSDCAFQPAVSDVVTWLHKIDIFVLPSISEALSNSIMEAMACGRCVVASRVGGNPELVRDGETGLLFESQNAQALAESLRRVIDDEVLRCKLANAGQRQIQENFSIHASANCVAQIYESLIDRR